MAVDKIPTMFVRDPADMSRVTRALTPGCLWVVYGEGVATRKWDGTNVRVTVKDGKFVKLEKRRNPTREEKAAGAEPGYIDAHRDDPADKHIFAAVDACTLAFAEWPDGSWPCEAIGPKIQGGIESSIPALTPFSLPWFTEHSAMDCFPRDFDGIRDALSDGAIEGVVFHHPDGRMAKIKGRDFGIKRKQ